METLMGIGIGVRMEMETRNKQRDEETEKKLRRAKYAEDLIKKAGPLKVKFEKPLVEFDSANIKEYQSGLLEKTNSREESKRPCMTEKVLGSVDSTTRISSTDFDAADNTAHLGGACQSGPVVSLSGNENRGEASKRECITERILGLEDLQQNSGGRRDNAAESFGAIYDPGIHTTHSLAQNSFKVVEALPTRKQPNDSVPLLSLGRLTLEGCVQEEKSQDLPRLLQIDGVEQRVTKSPRYLEGFTAQEVEKFSPPQEKYRENDEGKTPQDVLTEEREKWMKDSASLFSIVAALVATISITMLGLIKIDNGLPIFVKAQDVSCMFAILFSVASLLMFLCIRGQKILCFLHWKLMNWGQLTLFMSIIAMITAFCAGLTIVLGHKKACFFIPMVVLSCVIYTYYPRIFRKSSTPRQSTKGINSEAIIPKYLKSALHYLFALVSNQITVVVEEHYDGGISRNQVYDAAEVYLRTKISPDIRQFKVGKPPKQKSLDISVEKGEEIIDRFDNILELKWRFISVKPQNQNGYENEKRFFELSFNKKYRARVLNEYLPFVLAKSKEIKDNVDDDSYGGGMTVHELGLVDSTTIISTMDFDAADNSAHLMKECQSGLAVSLSENKSGGEALKREFVTKESILGLVDLQQNSGGRRDDAAKSFGTIYDLGIHTTHSLAQNSFEVLENPPTLETNSREESKRRCMTETVLGSIDSTTRALSTDFDAADNSAHLVRPYQSGPVVSLSGNENRGEASKTECITKRILGSEDLQQNFGGRRDNAAKSFGAIYDPGIHTTHSLAQNSFEVLEALLTRKQPNDSVPLLSLGRFRVEGCVQEGKSQDLPMLMQIDGVEQRVTKSHRYLGGFTAQSTSSSPWPIGLPDGRHIVVLNLLEKSTKNVAHVAMANQCSPTVPLPEKKMVRRTLKRKYRIMSVIFSIHQQHFGKRCEGTAKSFRAMRICRNHGINCVSMVKRIHKQHGINQWPFRQKWATRKGHSLGEKRPYEVSSLPMDLPRSLKLDCSGGLGAQSAVGLPDGGYVLSVGKTLKRKCKTMILFSLEDDQRHGVKRWGDAAKSLGRKRICRKLVVQHVSIAKRIHRQHVFHRWPFQQVTHLYFHFYQNWETMKTYSVRDKRPAEVLSLSTDGKLVSRHQLVHISWLVKFLHRPLALRGGGEIVRPIALLSSEFAATNNIAHGIRKDQSGSSSASHSEKKRPGEPEEDFEERDGSISYEDLQNLFGMSRDDAAKFLYVSISTLKRNCRKHGIGRWPYQARKNALKKPPDRHRGMNTSPTCKSVSTNGSNPASSQPKPTIPHATGSSDDRRNLLASQEESLLQHVSTPIYETISSRADPARSQPTPIVPHPTRNLEDQRNLLVSQEALLREHVSGPCYGTISPCTNPAPSETTPVVPHPTGNLEDQTNFSALPEEPLLSQLPPSIVPTMGGFADWRALSAFLNDSFPEGPGSGSIDCTVPASSNPAPSQPMPTNATERQNMDFVELKATYGDTTIKFQLPPMFETSELKEKVSKILECELGSFKVEYKDKDGEWILMGCDENVREYLQLLKSLGKQVTKLKISDTNTTNLCETCGLLMRKRPRS